MTSKLSKITIYITLIISIYTFGSCSKPTQNIHKELVPEWQFTQTDSEDWQNATVPGCVHLDLLNNNEIPDPFFGNNEQKVQWIEQKNWEYKTTFTLDDETLSKNAINLIFSGLDTYSKVYLNDSLILESDNMFVSYSVDCKNILKPENELLIKFQSPGKKAEELSKNYDYEFDGGTKVFTRKAGFHYGWDWGARLVTSGIWRPIYIEAYDLAKIENIHLVNQEIKDKKAKIRTIVEINSLGNFNVQISLKNESVLLKTEDFELRNGKNYCEINFEIENPEFWWTNGLGEPHLYDLNFELIAKNSVIENQTIRHGIRTIELVTNPDEYGESFYFKLNGIPVFMKGANYIPQDNFQSRVTDEHYQNLIDKAVKMNANMLRVWGGGIYEKDFFYDLCDENGILVWQDFMFACAMYPGDEDFIENVKIEAEQNIKRLRNHACLALWCGNNEIDEAWHNWGWAKKYTFEDSTEVRQGYEKLFLELLPNLVSKLDSGRAYRYSSPTFGRGNKNYKYIGDAHDWFVWHDGKPFEHFEQNVPRFMSEFGFQSFPAMHSISKFLDSADISLESEAMMNHQKHPRGNQLIKQYLENDYFVPDNFEHFVYLSQLMQAQGITKGIEAHRRAWSNENPYCGGTLFWQLNDCWPVVSWSAIDYYDDNKALYYFAKKAFQTILITHEFAGDRLNLIIVSDSLENIQAELIVEIKDFTGNLIFSEEKNITVKANTTAIYFMDEISALLKNKSKNEVFCEVQLKHNSKIISEKVIYFAKPVDLKLEVAEPEIKIIQIIDNRAIVEISSEVLIKNVYLDAGADVEFSDNYFDVLPNEKYTVKCISKSKFIDDFPLINVLSLNILSN